MSEITTNASSIFHLPPRVNRPKSLSQRRTIAQRSLEGLVTFLISYFRYLPVSEALHYLVLLKADLLVAVLLIEHIQGVGCRWFPISSPTIEVALRCAAMCPCLPHSPSRPSLLPDRCYWPRVLRGSQRFLPLIVAFLFMPSSNSTNCLRNLSRSHLALRRLFGRRLFA